MVAPAPAAQAWVVQVGTQRKNMPHWSRRSGILSTPACWERIGQVDLCCYYHMRANGNPPVSAVPDYLDYEMWTARRSCARMTGCRQALVAHIHGVRQRHRRATCAFTCSTTTRWMLGLGWPKRISSNRRHLRRHRAPKSETSPTPQDGRLRILTTSMSPCGSSTAHGHAAQSQVSLGAHALRRKGHAAAGHGELRLHPRRQKAS